MLTIDVVLPSYRLDEKYLCPILNLDVPEGFSVRYIIIVDNPHKKIPQALSKLLNEKNTLLLRNATNMGASCSRNIGIEHSDAEWILFLDDDVKPCKDLLYAYKKAMDENKDASGFFGPTVYPEPVNTFTWVLKLSDELDTFTYAIRHKAAICTTTSNVLVRRNAIGEIRFSSAFDKKGGGEDFAFFLELFNKTNRFLYGVKDAVVFHPWWHNGKRDYSRFWRWHKADSKLFERAPKQTFYEFPNSIEMGLILVLGLSVLAAFKIVPFAFLPAALAAVFVVETGIEALRLIKNHGFSKIYYLFEIVFLKSFINLSCLAGKIRALKITHLFKRLNFTDKKTDWSFRYISGLKFLAYSVVVVFLYIFGFKN